MSLLKLLRRRRTGITIVAPRARVMRLGERGREELLREDQDVLRRSFGGATACTSLPQADVLFLYGELQHDGGFAGSTETLRSCISKSGARVVVLAQPNASDRVRSALASLGGVQANVVCVVERGGAAFTRFFASLFATMLEGASMGEAWGGLTSATGASRSDAERLSDLAASEAGPIVLCFEGLEFLRLD